MTRHVVTYPTGKTSPTLIISEVARSLRRVAEPDLKKRRLTVTQTRALLYIVRNEGCRQVDLAGMMGLKTSSLGNLIDKLELVELVRRESSALDKRICRLFPGKNAEKELALISDISLKSHEIAFQGLSTDQVQLLHEMLEQIHRNLSSHKGKPKIY